MNKYMKFHVVFLMGLLFVGMTPITPVSAADTGNGEFLDALNAALHNIIDSGDYDTYFTKWFEGSVVLDDDSTADTATTFPEASSSGTLADIITAGKIVFGSDTTYPPFESIDENGTVVGFDADMAHAIAAEFSEAYGTTIVAEMMTTDWDPIIPNLIADEFDAILSAMTKTEERAQQIDFTRAYYSSSQGVLRGQKDISTLTIDSVDDLNDSSVIVAVQTGTTSDIYAQDLEATVHAFATFDLALQDVLNGDAHVLLGDTPVLAFYEAENTGVELVDTFSEENFGIGVRKDKTEDDSPFPFTIFFMFLVVIPILKKIRKY